jgi:hypothetical protein
MVVQQKAGSMSMTLTRAATSFLVDHTWSPIDYSQYLARTHRKGQKRPCEHYNLVFGLAQRTIVSGLERGEAFDTNSRASLENLFKSATKDLNNGPTQGIKEQT